MLALKYLCMLIEELKTTCLQNGIVIYVKSYEVNQKKETITTFHDSLRAALYEYLITLTNTQEKKKSC